MDEPKKTKHTSRKYIIACGCILIATGLLLNKSIIGSEWVEVAKWVTGLFMAGNVGEKYAAKKEIAP